MGKVSQSEVGAGSWQSVLSCTVSSHHLAKTSEQTEDFMCAVVIMIYRV
jgi:hypothetical protein